MNSPKPGHDITAHPQGPVYQLLIPKTVTVALKAKFHYAIQVADLVADMVSDLSQTGSSYLGMSR